MKTIGEIQEGPYSYEGLLAAAKAAAKAEQAQIDGFRAELPPPPDSANCFAKSGRSESLDEEFVRAERKYNDILRAAKKEHADLAGAADATLNPEDLHKRGFEWEDIYEAHKGTNPECGSVASDMMQYLHSRARQITRTRSVLMGGDDRTRMTRAELKRLHDCRGEIAAAAQNPPRGYFPKNDLGMKWRRRADLLALTVSVFLGGAIPDGSGKTFCARNSSRIFRILVGHDGIARAWQMGDQGEWERCPDIYDLLGKIIGRPEETDLRVKAAAVNALIKYARIISPNALAGLPEWNSAPAVAARIAAGEPAGGARIAGTYQTPKRPPVRPRALGDWGIPRACHWRVVGKVGAAVMAALLLANPPKRKRNYTPRLAKANMSDAELMARMTSAAESREAAGHAFRFLRDSGLLERLRRVRKYRAWKDCLLELMEKLAMRRRCVRLRAVIVVVWQAFKGGRFNDSDSRVWHSIIALAKVAGCSRETMRKALKALEADGMLTRGFSRGCASYCLIKDFTIAAANAIYDALGKGAKWGRLTIAAVAKMFAPPPPATAPPVC